jgi:hypothetical protein
VYTDAERRRYYPNEENVPLSVAVTETVSAHGSPAIRMETFSLFDHIDPDALNSLFDDLGGVGFSMQFCLDESVVEVWGDDTVEIRVTDADGRR